MLQADSLVTCSLIFLSFLLGLGIGLSLSVNLKWRMAPYDNIAKVNANNVTNTDVNEKE
jgi:hypothetical protein